ncbi:hypothetical protein LWI28_006016 [Acer negundo]|uniref:MADS-box domain-containing protein n=1 Tax=Acer negundo TaxID=4023 RepID=A0AAD5NF28_ACENE|nr:hypothetical protein LWI28_006016 [Acer negundo]KAK4833361.1 hypothetical protein QYF36_003477 [Acer negundo]
MNAIKKTKGRQKIEMKRVEHEAKREVTFSKRKKGLFNKASELCELCGAEVALILFSPHLKPFTFGHLDANEVLQRYLTRRDGNSPGPVRRNVLHGLNGVREQYNESLKRLEEEEKKSKDQKSGPSSSGGFWWDDQQIENFNELDELEQYVESMEKLKKIVQARVEEIDLSGNYFANEFINDQNLLAQNNFSLIPHSNDFYGV